MGKAEHARSTEVEKSYERIKLFSKHIDVPEYIAHDVASNACRARELSDIGKVVDAARAVSKIRDGATITMGGFVGCGSPEYLLWALRQRFEDTSRPKGLHVVIVASTGDRNGGGSDQLAVEGLVAKYTFGWTGNCPNYVKLIQENKIQAWNLPLGIDPREGGGKLNACTKDDVVKLVELGGQQYLWYRAFKIDVALIRATTADTEGNVTFEKEAFFGDALNMAIAAHSSGGLVIVQVERVVEKGSLHPRLVHLPSAFVDQVVLAPPEFHHQSMARAGYDGSLSGEVRKSSSSSSQDSLFMGTRKIISHRCMLAFDRPNAVVNLGVGMPEGVAPIVNQHAAKQNPDILPLTLSTEVGVVGGFPAAGPLFGAAYNPEAVMPTSTMIDLIQGGNLDAAVLGCAEVDEAGNVNVSKFSGKHPGCGGFIDISQSAKQVIFAGTFTSGGLKVEVHNGKLRILQEGRSCKFRRKVQEKTFAASSAGERQVLYVTERCVFKLESSAQGTQVKLIEVAPGIRLKEDILDQMEFRPLVEDYNSMDPRCFLP